MVVSCWTDFLSALRRRVWNERASCLICVWVEGACTVSPVGGWRDGYLVAEDNFLSLSSDIKVYESLGALQNYSLLNPNRTQAAVIFSPDMKDNNTVPFSVVYTLVVNISTAEFDVAPHVQRAVDSAILQVAVCAGSVDGDDGGGGGDGGGAGVFCLFRPTVCRGSDVWWTVSADQGDGHHAQNFALVRRLSGGEAAQCEPW